MGECESIFVTALETIVLLKTVCARHVPACGACAHKHAQRQMHILGRFTRKGGLIDRDLDRTFPNSVQVPSFATVHDTQTLPHLA